MQSHPLVTVVIPSFNHTAYIDVAVESVLAQTYPEIELVIVDDGSTDNSHDVIRKYEHHPQVTIILNTENAGQSAVLNQALAVAKGEFVAFLPSDDWYLPHKTEVQVEKFKNSSYSVGVVYANGQRFFEDTGKTIDVKLPVHEGYIAKRLIQEGNFIYPVTPLYRRAVFDHIQPNEQFRAEGEAVHLRIALKYEYAHVDENVAVMRDHSSNIGKAASIMNDELIRHREWYFNLPDLPEDVRSLRDDSLLRIYRVKAMQLILDRQETRKGRENIHKCFALRPSAVLQDPKLLVSYSVSFLPNSWIARITAMRKWSLAKRDIHYTSQK